MDEVKEFEIIKSIIESAVDCIHDLDVIIKDKYNMSGWMQPMFDNTCADIEACDTNLYELTPSPLVRHARFMLMDAKTMRDEILLHNKVKVS